MKVVVVISSLKAGGAERVVSTLTREWAKEHQVLIALFDASSQAYDYGGEVADLGTSSRRGPVKKLHNAVLRSIRLARVLRRQRPHRIVSFMESANFPTIVAAAMTGLLGHLRVSVRNNPAIFPYPYRLLMSIAYRLAECVVTPSTGVRNALKKMGLPACKLSVIPNPAATHIGATNAPRMGFPLRYILGVGRLEPQKGFDRLLKAYSKMDQSGIDLVILGAGTQRDALLAISQELDIMSRLHLPGVVSDVEAWYRHAECFVLTSHYEGSPNVLVEAMANGCPVVSFDCPYGPAEIVDGGRNGMLVSQDDIPGLADAIQRLVSDRVFAYAPLECRPEACSRILGGEDRPTLVDQIDRVPRGDAGSSMSVCRPTTAIQPHRGRKRKRDDSSVTYAERSALPECCGGARHRIADDVCTREQS